VCGPEEGHHEKRCEIQGGHGQEMAVMVAYNVNNDNSGGLLYVSLGISTKFT